MKILFAYDGSEAAEAALLDLPHAGIPTGSVIDVLTIDEPNEPLIEFDITTVSRQHTRTADPLRIARLGIERLELLMPAVELHARSAIGSAGETIVGMAEMEGADLVVIGAGDERPLARLHFGNTASRVLHRARCPVRIGRSRRPRSPHAPLRIVVGVDGSPDARAAVRSLQERSLPPGSEIWLATAIDAGSSPPEVREAHALAHALQRLYTTLFERDGLSVEGVIHEGDAVGVLLSLVDDVAADALFVGTSGAPALFSVLLGSTAETLAQRAPCSVEVVRTVTRFGET